MKLIVLGGGGVRSVFLAKFFVNRAPKISVTDIMFMDNDIQKLKIYGGLAKETAARIDDSIRFSLTSDPVEALRDADPIITTMRVGEDEARILDEKLALQYRRA
jgi:6-phospho-beta-glucosidase